MPSIAGYGVSAGALSLAVGSGAVVGPVVGVGGGGSGVGAGGGVVGAGTVVAAGGSAGPVVAVVGGWVVGALVGACRVGAGRRSSGSVEFLATGSGRTRRYSPSVSRKTTTSTSVDGRTRPPNRAGLIS
ncbi:hypothetical protein [Rhizomonospora bruguierae]|uniref:hypothetical protein n=1 Tax=Rhizomonospora bruguierae TaxID=1581705 RepID=UPI001BCDE2E5|nr:hypothetical protein [Micromonospora sp. NBRC 107566]